MKKEIIIFTLLVFFAACAFGNSVLNVQGSIKSEGLAIENASVKIINKKEVTATTTGKRGKFEITLQANTNYKLVISKKGYYSQTIAFNTYINSDETDSWKYKFSTELFLKIASIPQSELDFIMGNVKYNTKFDEFEFEPNIESNIKLDEFIDIYETLRTKHYKILITKADSAFQHQNYNKAKSLYRHASILNGYEIYPDLQLYTIERIVAQDIRIDNRYTKHISIADKLYANKDYDKAKAHYKRAYKLKGTDYSKQQISKIKKIVPLEDILTAK